MGRQSQDITLVSSGSGMVGGNASSL
jgi:hypothetical protein